MNVEEWQVSTTEYMEVFFPSTDGLLLQGFFLTAQRGMTTGIGPPEQAPTIIFSHGHGPYVGQQSQMIPAKGLQQQGFNVFLFNNQGLGKSQKPPSGQAVRTFGADELTNTEGAIKFVTEDPDGVLPFATPLHRVGLYAQSGSNAMVWFFRLDIPGLIMHGSIYDWYDQFEKAAADAGIGWVPLADELFMRCASAPARGGGIKEENYKDQLDRSVYDPTGRRVLLMHNKADEYNLYEDHFLGWEKDLKAKGFDLETYTPDEDGEDGCNSHVTVLFGPQRKAHFQRMCSFWELVFNVSASCDAVLSFDTALDG